MDKILSRWKQVFVFVTAIKLVMMVWSPTYSDLFNWATGAALVLRYLAAGKFPPVSVTGVYGPLQVTLSPLYWIWTKLPIDHPPISFIQYSSHSTIPAITIIFLMRLLPFSCDVAIGFLLLKLVKQITDSDEKGKIALLLWYANPFNIFWIEEFGTMDVIPAFVLLIAVIYGTNSRWFKSGLCVAAATALRIFPILTLPFFLIAAKDRKLRRCSYFMSGVMLPIVVGLASLYLTGAATMASMLNTPLNEYWLLDFLGFKLTNQFVRMVPVLLAVQFYQIVRFWKNYHLVDLVAASLLALLVAHTYGGINHHFIWVVPFLTASIAINYDELWIFVVTFVTASLYPFIFPIPAMPMVSDTIHYFDPFYAGCFFAAKAAYLIQINLKRIRS